MSKKQMENTEDVFKDIYDSVSGVEDVHSRINSVVGECSEKVEELQKSMEEHARRYEQVQENPSQTGRILVYSTNGILSVFFVFENCIANVF